MIIGRALASFALLGLVGVCVAGEQSVDDFRFDGPLGSQGAKIEKVARNHFRITAGHAPGHTEWCNYLQFRIIRNAKGNDLRIDGEFTGGTGYAFFEWFYSWSYDGKDWRPIQWQNYSKKDGNALATLLLPVMEQDTVQVGALVPLTNEELEGFVAKWKTHPAVQVHVLGQSLGKHDIYRIEITDPNSPYPRSQRWVHYSANQHPLEHNAQWRMVGMIRWLLSAEGADARRRFICHFIVKSVPEGTSNGWLRVNQQGLDMNRSYTREGADPRQGHEPYLIQKDLEGIMASESPATTIWSMHVWPGAADPRMNPGPETDNLVGPASKFAEILTRLDPNHTLVKPLAFSNRMRPRSKPWTPAASAPTDPNKPFRSGGAWGSGPGAQFGVTNILCEGGGGLYTRKENLDSGVVIIRALAEYYKGVKPSPAGSRPATPASATQVAPNPKPAAHRGNDGLDRLEVGAGPLWTVYERAACTNTGSAGPWEESP